jgi:hypothetical protein
MNRLHAETPRMAEADDLLRLARILENRGEWSASEAAYERVHELCAAEEDDLENQRDPFETRT